MLVYTPDKDNSLIGTIKLTMFTAILFDKDGVLLDLEGTWLNSAIAFTHYLSQKTGGSHPASVFQTIIGIDEISRSIDHGGLFASGSLRDQFDACSRDVPELAPLFADSAKVRVMIDDVFLKEREQTLNTIGSVPNGNVAAGVTDLKEAGYKLGVLTNDSEQSARRGCSDIKIADMMDVFIGYDSGYGSKPGADGFLAACTALGVTPAETVMIGDTSADIGAAKAAGAGLFIGVSALYPERTKPLQDIEHIVADTTGIAPILARLAKAS